MESKYCNNCRYIENEKECKLYKSTLNYESTVNTISGDIIVIPMKCKRCIYEDGEVIQLIIIN